MAKKVGAKVVGLPNYVVIHGESFRSPRPYSSVALLTPSLALQPTTASPPSLEVTPVKKYKSVHASSAYRP
jgi:hypothetical protein